jgi:hypothetical protein
MRTTLAVFLPWLALAQEDSILCSELRCEASFQLQLFEPELSDRAITVPGPSTLRHLQYDMGTVLHYGHKPLVFASSETAETEVVRQQTMLDVLAWIGIFGRADVGVALPLAVSQSGEYFDRREDAAGESVTRTGLGDTRLVGKVRLLGNGRGLGLAFAPVVTLPTGNNAASGTGSKNNLTGEKAPTVRPRVVGGWRDGRVMGSWYLGYLWRKNTDYISGADERIVVGDQILYGAGGAYRLVDNVEAIGEVFGRMGAVNRNLDAAPAELDVALRAEPLPRKLTGLYVMAGGGAGIHAGIGTPVVRAFLGVNWAPDYADTDGDHLYDRFDLCADRAEDRDGFDDGDGCPDPDNDQDLLQDGSDRCPTEAEDRDEFEDEDGCPDPDNDGDRIPDIQDECPFVAGSAPYKGCTAESYDSDGDGLKDASDKCVQEAEDPDGFADEDGCPDPDNDADGVPDGEDDCPAQAEDKDDFQDGDGCPEPDNDADGVPDASDKCPMVPGAKSRGGCP